MNTGFQNSSSETATSLGNEKLLKFQELQRRRLELKARTEALEAKKESRKLRKLNRKQSSHLNKANGSQHNTDCKQRDAEITETEFCEVKKYLNINSHLSGPIPHNVLEPKSHLEERIHDAIDKADFDTAEKLNDALATREFATKLHTAFQAKRYAEEKKKEDAEIKAKKRKKLHWGFDAKQRWEMKGNL